MTQVRTTFFIIFTPEHDFAGRVTSVELNRFTKQRPPKLGLRDVAVKTTFVFESAMFEQYMPEVEIRLESTRDLFLPQAYVDSPERPVEEVDPTTLLEEALGEIQF